MVRRVGQLAGIFAYVYDRQTTFTRTLRSVATSRRSWDHTYLDTILNPTIIFDILSESTEHRDIGIKWRLYQQIESLKQYVIIYQDTARVEVHSRQSATEWLEQVVAGQNGHADLPAINVTLHLRDLYERIVVDQDASGP